MNLPKIGVDDLGHRGFGRKRCTAEWEGQEGLDHVGLTACVRAWF